MSLRAPRTKLIATLGPACADPNTLGAMIDAGVDVCRLNFSHGTLEQHAAALARVRSLARQRDLPVAVLGDLCGPKIRLNTVPGDGVTLERGQTVLFVPGEGECTPGQLTTTLPELTREVEVGQRIYIDDGLVRLLVTDKTHDALVCTVTVGGSIKTRKGVNLPDTRLSLPALTEADLVALDWAIDHDLDYVALSFVRRPADLRRLRDRLSARGSPMRVVIKVEMVEALQHLDELIAASDAVLVARGDLGVEMDIWQVPLIQKAITVRCREVGVPVIIATQMLQSMISNPMPTRAEVSDVANAILDGTDAVMLSAETAAGEYPVQAVDMTTKLALVTEAYGAAGAAAAQRYIALGHHTADPEAVYEVSRGGIPARSVGGDGTAGSIAVEHPWTSAIAHAAVQAARDLNARLIVVWTATGMTARLVAAHRLPIPTVALSDDPRVCRQLALVFGVVPLLAETQLGTASDRAALDRLLLERGLAEDGEVAVVITSTRPAQPGATDTALIHRFVRASP